MMESNYPLGENETEKIRASSGRPLSEITLDALGTGVLTSADLQISADTLRNQAQIALAAGYAQLAQNLVRAAELTRVPNEELLLMYETLRPGRASHAEMIALAERLEQVYHASESAHLVKEAALVYLSRGLVKR